MIQVLDEDKYKDRAGEWRQTGGGSKAKAGRNVRARGLLVWHGLVVVSLNFNATGATKKGLLPDRGGKATAAQERCLQRIWDAVKFFVDQKEAGKGLGVPRTFADDWSAELERLRVSYTGEVVQKSRPLTLKQILPGLPSEAHGAMIPLLDLCEGEVLEKLKDPRRLLKKDLVEKVPTPQISAAPGEWPKIARALLERKLIRPVSNVVKVDGVEALNGAFGVVKEGKMTEDGEEVLRFIMDLRATNLVSEVITGDVSTLAGASSYQHVVLEDGEVLAVSGDDLTAAFYLFGLPEAWSEVMVFREKVSFSDLGLPGDGTTYVGAAALPMGWHSAVGVMQHLHRRLALRPPERFGAGLEEAAEIRRDAVFPEMPEESMAWSVYLDDTTFLEKVSRSAFEHLKGKPPAEQQLLRGAYRHWGIPTNPDKALERCSTVERLGARIDGKVGILAGSTNRVLQLMGLGCYLRSLERVSRKQMQIYCGKAVHLVQFRRCLFSYLDEIWKQVGGKRDHFALRKGSLDEMLALEAAMPMAYCNLRAKLDPLVTASDASETGGGTCFSSRLTHLGQEEAKRILQGGDPDERGAAEDEVKEDEKILVFDFFGGIGGLPRSLERSGARITHMVVIEKERDLRRLHRRVWPGSEEKVDIAKLKGEDLKACFKRVPGITGVVAGGGSPCQGLSRLSSERLHLADERSKLFFELSRCLKEIKEEARQRKLWFLGFVENVVPDEKDVDAMSEELGWDPLLVDPVHHSRARRPRLFWVSEKPTGHPEVILKQRGRVTELVMKAELEPLEAFLEKGWRWKSGEEEGNDLHFPTFTRAIRRRRPPPRPAGLEGCDEETRERWQADEFRYPPYTYKKEYMISNERNEMRPLKASERELLMGYLPGHVKLLHRDPEKSRTDESQSRMSEDLECSALGNSFHTGAAAGLFDLLLWSMGKKKSLRGIKKIQQAFLEQLAEIECVKEEATEDETTSEGEAEEALGEEADFGNSDPDDNASVGSDKTARANRQAEGRADLPWSQTLEDVEYGESDLKLSAALVAQFCRRQEAKGCDVRLDLGTLYRADAFPRTTINPQRWKWAVAHAYPFFGNEHINVLELRALLMAFEWRSRRAVSNDQRALHLSDSQVALAVAIKGRSSSRRLNFLLRRYASLQLAAGLWPILAWVESHLNPADEPSRRF